MLPRHVQSSARAVDLLSPKLFPALAFLGVKSTNYTFWNYFHKVSGRNPLVRHTAAFSERKLSTFRLELPLPGRCGALALILSNSSAFSLFYKTWKPVTDSQ